MIPQTALVIPLFLMLSNIKLLGFFSHVQTELKKNALSAGFDEVIPRSVFARDLEELLTADYTDTGAITS